MQATGDEIIARALYDALEPFVNAAGIENGLSLFSKARDGLTPIRIVVTKAQVLEARRVLAKARPA